MYLFTLIALPAFCLGTYFMRSKNTRKAFLPPVITGFITASLYCAIEAFFVIYNHLWTENLISSFFYIFLTQTLIPSAAITALFFLFSKDPVSYKIDSILPLLSSFYSVYLSYRIFTFGESESFFLLFEKVILYISYLTFVYTFIKKAYRNFTSKKYIIGLIFIILTIISLAVPALLEILWYYKISCSGRLISSGAYLVLSIVVFLKLTVIEFKE